MTGSTSWRSFMIRALAKLDLLKIRKMLTSSKFRFFGQFLDVVETRSQVERHVTYIYSERTFYWLSNYFYKTQKTVFFLDLLAIFVPPRENTGTKKPRWNRVKSNDCIPQTVISTPFRRPSPQILHLKIIGFKFEKGEKKVNVFTSYSIDSLFSRKNVV